MRNATVMAALAALLSEKFSAATPAPLNRCAAGRDGECTNPQCPQLRDNEPRATGRHCPLDNDTGDE
jgi:hypothetical protein